jgi:hypothetical protein
MCYENPMSMSIAQNIALRTAVKRCGASALQVATTMHKLIAVSVLTALTDFADYVNLTELTPSRKLKVPGR